MPTNAKIASTIVATNGFFSNPNDLKNVAGSFGVVSSILVMADQIEVTIDIKPYTNKVFFQSPHLVTAIVTRIGPSNELIALINCDRLMKLENRSGDVTSRSNGFDDTWMMVLPIPINKKDNNNEGYVYWINGINIPIDVNITPNNNTRFLPTLDCKTLHGSDKIKNHINTMDGNI
jgi:hypothetical protein